MPVIQDTAYPYLKQGVTIRDLREVYTPTQEEYALANRVAKGNSAKLGFLILLKTFQRLGYFPTMADIPRKIIRCITKSLSVDVDAAALSSYEASGTQRRHIAIIRETLDVKEFSLTAKKQLNIVLKDAALVREDLVDLINVGIEELIRQRFELPAFDTLVRAARRVRAEVNHEIYQEVQNTLSESALQKLNSLITVEENTTFSLWNRLKIDPGPASIKRLKEWIDQLLWLNQYDVAKAGLADIPVAKLQQFAAEAKSLNAADMKKRSLTKQYTLSAALVRVTVARTLDDLGDMFIKRIRRIHRQGKVALNKYLQKNQTQTEELVTLLHDLVLAMKGGQSADQTLQAMKTRVGDDPDAVLTACQVCTAYVDNNYFPFLWKYHSCQRQVMFTLFEHLPLSSTSQDDNLLKALQFLQQHRYARKHYLSAPISLDLSWIPEKWRKTVVIEQKESTDAKKLDRHQFELCVFSQIMEALKSVDLFIDGSLQYADYRQQLISWKEFDRTLADYSKEVGLPTDSITFVKQLKEQFEQAADKTDAEFPANDSVRIDNGEVVLSKINARTRPTTVKKLEQLLADRMSSINILDMLMDTEHWLNWTQDFGPLSGFESRLDDASDRYMTTVFCYGCNMGPSQTAGSLNGNGMNRRQIAWLNQHHVTEDKLQAAITTIINGYNRFLLPKQWGSGKSASADGTKWDLYEQNLLAENHIRYGGYGGIAYYHVSDTYIALFSRFIPCGVWEAVYILDALLENQSDIQPDTLHGDTQAQNAPVFGLAYLLGIQLMPRIRNLKDLKFYRSVKEKRYKNIDCLFSDTIDWNFIETHLKDILRVVLSIRAGRISASTILRRLGTYSRKNKLYQAMRELGRVIRTLFLLKYINEPELRRVINAATNKSESFNKLAKWVAFGGEGAVLRENNREKQRKLIRYNHLVANCLIFHNVQAMTKILHEVTQEGIGFTNEDVAYLSPYLTSHINRFGKYWLDRSRKPPQPNYALEPVKQVM